MSEQVQKKKFRQRVYKENPYDLETFFESLSIASDKEKALLFIDRLFLLLRNNPEAEISDLSFQALKDLKLINMK